MKSILIALFLTAISFAQVDSMGTRWVDPLLADSIRIYGDTSGVVTTYRGRVAAGVEEFRWLPPYAGLWRMKALTVYEDSLSEFTNQDTVTIFGTAVSDSLGSELFANGSMEANSDWSSAFADVSEQSNTRSHAGTYSWKTVTSAAGGTQQVVTVETSKSYWIQVYVWLVEGAIFKINTDAGQLDLYLNGSTTPVSDFDTFGEWVHVAAKHTAGDTETFVRFNAATSVTEYYIDDATMKELLP